MPESATIRCRLGTGMPSILRLATALAVAMSSARMLPAQCLPRGDSVAIATLGDLHRAIVQPMAASFRTKLGMPLEPGDAMEVVRDTVLCSRAAAVLYRVSPELPDTLRFVLLRSTDRFVTIRSPYKSLPRIDLFDLSMEWLEGWQVIWGQRPMAPPTMSECLGPQEGFSIAILGRVRFALTSPKQEWYRKLLGLEGIPADSVRHVSDAEACHAAIAAIRRHHEPREITVVVLTLFRVGRFYWAETAYPRAGEWTLTYILDEAGMTVLGQY